MLIEIDRPLGTGPDPLHPPRRHQVPAGAHQDPAGDQEQGRRREILVGACGWGSARLAVVALKIVTLFILACVVVAAAAAALLALLLPFVMMTLVGR